MKSLIATLTLCLLTACGIDTGETVIVDMDESLSDEQVEAVLTAVDGLNNAAEHEVLRAVQGDGRLIQAGRIHVDAESPQAGHQADTKVNHWCARTHIGDRVAVHAIQHELMHGLGYGHEKEPTSLMYEGGSDPRSVLTADSLEFLRGL